MFSTPKILQNRVINNPTPPTPIITAVLYGAPSILRVLIARLTAECAVIPAHPKTHQDLSARSLRTFTIALIGTTAYSANPAIEYEDTSLPSLSFNRFVPSNIFPFKRLFRKKLEQILGKPDLHWSQLLHGMMKLVTTKSPSAKAKSLLS